VVFDFRMDYNKFMEKLLLLLSLSSIPTQGLARGAGAGAGALSNALKKYIPDSVQRQ